MLEKLRAAVRCMDPKKRMAGQCPESIELTEVEAEFLLFQIRRLN